MKKTILAVLIALMIATPCMAQEVEPEGFFSIDGTLWWVVSLKAFLEGYQIHYGFYQGNVYVTETELGSFDNRCALVESFSYVNLLVVSFFNYPLDANMAVHGIMQPLGIGMVLHISRSESNTFGFICNLLIKVDNSWTPPPDCEPLD